VTEQLFPDDMANGLVDGTLPVADVPASLQGVADVLRAANQAITEDELKGMAALMQRFTAEVAIESAPATIHGSSPMFSARTPRRVAAIVAVTLLAAGTAAASGGAFSSSGSSRIRTEDVVVLDGSTTTDAPAVDTTTTTTTTATEASAEDTTTTATATAAATKTGGGEREDSHLYGKCTAFTHGSAKNLENPAFSELQDEADAAGISVDEYCAMTIAAHKVDDGADGTDEADDADEDGNGSDHADHGNGTGHGTND